MAHKVILDQGVTIAGQRYPHGSTIDEGKLKDAEGAPTGAARIEFAKHVKDGSIVQDTAPRPVPPAEEG